MVAPKVAPRIFRVRCSLPGKGNALGRLLITSALGVSAMLWLAIIAVF